MTIKEMRRLLNDTTEQFSMRYHIPENELLDWESGKTAPPIYVINLLERAVLEDVKTTAELQENFLEKQKQVFLIQIQHAGIREKLRAADRFLEALKEKRELEVDFDDCLHFLNENGIDLLMLRDYKLNDFTETN